MNIVHRFLVLFLSGQFLLSCTLAHSGSNESSFPLVRMADNQNYCDGTPVIELVYPDTFKGEKHEFTLLQVIKEQKTVFETNLAWQRATGGSYVCLDESFLANSVVVIGYGLHSCRGYVYGFKVDPLLSVSDKGRQEMTPVHQKNEQHDSCERE